MKKGIFSALLAVLLTVAFSFSFISCKKADAPEDEAVTEEKAPADEAKKEDAKEEAKEEKK